MRKFLTLQYGCGLAIKTAAHSDQLYFITHLLWLPGNSLCRLRSCNSLLQEVLNYYQRISEVDCSSAIVWVSPHCLACCTVGTIKLATLIPLFLTPLHAYIMFHWFAAHTLYIHVCVSLSYYTSLPHLPGSGHIPSPGTKSTRQA